MGAIVSIVVPVYNAEKYIQRCLDSLRNQTLHDIEIILVDDGSTDGSLQLCGRFAEEDSRIRVIHKENEGLGFARNTGLEAASGAYVGFVDVDDYVDTAMFETLYRAAQTHNADLVLSGTNFVGGILYENVTADDVTRKYCFAREELFEGEAGRKKLMLGVAGALPNEPEDSRYGYAVWKNLYRREILTRDNIRFLSERKVLSEDELFMLDYIRCMDCAVGIPGAYYYYCRNSASITKRYDAAAFEKSLLLLTEVEKRLSAVLTEDEYRLYTDRHRQAYARVACIKTIAYAKKQRMPKKELYGRLDAICASPELAAALRRYPWHRLPLLQAAFAFTMRYRLYGLQCLIFDLRQKLKKQ